MEPKRKIWADTGVDIDILPILASIEDVDGSPDVFREQIWRLGTLAHDRSKVSIRLWGDADFKAAEAIARLGDLRQPRGTRDRLRGAAEDLRSAVTVTERRSAVREFRAALAEFLDCLLRFLVRVLILLLSRMLGRVGADDVPVWKPDPIDATPQITPRGPNTAFPVTTYRGGRRSSAQGSAVLAA